MIKPEKNTRKDTDSMRKEYLMLPKNKRNLTAVLALFLALCLALSGCSIFSSSEMVDIEKITVIDTDECSVTITGITDDYLLVIEFENKSSDTTYMFELETASVNDVQATLLYSQEINPGNELTDALDFSEDTTLAENGIDTFTDIEITFVVYDANDLFADRIAEETVHIYPYGEENASAFEREDLDTDNTLIDDDQVTVIITGYTQDNGLECEMFIVNKTDEDIEVTANDVYLNGNETDPLWTVTVSGGKCLFSSLSWDDSELAEMSITDISQIEFMLSVYSGTELLTYCWIEDNIS